MLQSVIHAYGIRSLLDIPCGDFQWMPLLLAHFPGLRYFGGDIVADLVVEHRKSFSSPKWDFGVVDMVARLPNTQFDLVLMRDVLQHLSPGDIRQVIQNLNANCSIYETSQTSSGATTSTGRCFQYWLVTDYPHVARNSRLRGSVDSSGWATHYYNLQRPPYSLPPPLARFAEGGGEGKTLALYKLPLPDLPSVDRNMSLPDEFETDVDIHTWGGRSLHALPWTSSSPSRGRAASGTSMASGKLKSQVASGFVEVTGPNIPKGCSMVRHEGSAAASKSIQFVFCSPPGAADIRLMQRGVERLIGKAILTMITKARGNSSSPHNKVWMVDVGMNEGALTLVSAAAGAHVVSFDLAPACFEQVARSAQLSGLSAMISLRNAALSYENRSITVQNSWCNPEGSSADDASAKEASRWGTSTGVAVRGATLDAELSGIRGHIAVLKIDAEGSEIHIFRGAARSLAKRRYRSLIVELSPHWWHRYGLSVRDGVYVLEKTIATGFVPFVFPNPDERLEARAGLAARPRSLFGVANLRRVDNVSTFIIGRIKQQRGCNLMLVRLTDM